MQLADELKAIFPKLHYADRHMLDMHLWIPVKDTDATWGECEIPVVETSVATGMTHGSMLGKREWIAAGTPLSRELASVIHSTLLWGDFCLPPSLGEQFGTLDDQDFLAQKPKMSRDAGSQLKEAMEAFFAQLNGLIGGVGNWTISQTLIGEQCYKLCAAMISRPNDAKTRNLVAGIAKVEFYEVIGIFDSRGAPLPKAISRVGMGSRESQQKSRLVVSDKVFEEAI